VECNHLEDQKDDGRIISRWILGDEGLEVDESSSGSCPMVDFNISGTEPFEFHYQEAG
jgi:hypothetical protein